MDPAVAKREPIPLGRSVSDLKIVEDVVVESSVQDDRLSSRLCRFAGIGWSVRCVIGSPRTVVYNGLCKHVNLE